MKGHPTVPLPLEAVEVLAALPVGIFIADEAGKIVWVNDTLCDQLGVTREGLIGLERLALPAKKTLSLSKTIEWMHTPGSAGGPDRRFECITQKLGDAASQVSVGCVIDVSRYDAGKRPRHLYPELKDPGRLDGTTGLLSAATMQQELIAQVSRSRRYHNPLSIVVIRLHETEPTAAAVSVIQKQRLLRRIAKMLKEKLRWVDVVGCWDKEAFMLILPETAHEPATKLTRKIESYIARLQQEEERTGSNAVSVSIGLAEWSKGDDMQTLLARVERSAGGGSDERAGQGIP